jgi:hypothetical protein
MKKNVGKVDRISRVVLGLAIIAFGIINQTWWGLVGAGLMLPAIMGSDPLYTLVGINTNKS